jgi:TolB-like protein/tetratricopeptide (TPR) repeat protein
MSNLFGELKRRNVVRVGVAYMVAGWVIMQIIDIVVEPLRLPDWTASFFIVLLAVGFPIALLLSWAYEITPEGVKKSEEVGADASIAPSTGRKLDRLIIAGLVVAVGFLLWDRTTAPPSGSPVAKGAISIAVLPFTDMSAAQDQEYFGDGIAEEILNTLVRVEALSVSSRTSAFAFKGSNLSLPEIAGSLGVTHVVEGSVRSAGNQIRVTAQLIEVASDRHLWSESYDRKLDDIFAIQDDISGAISRALQVELIGTPGSEAQKHPTSNIEAYRLYLQGHHLMLQRGTQNLEAAAERLRQAVDLDPRFALAWADLGASLALYPSYTINADAELYAERGELAASRAIALAPDLAQAWAVKAIVASNRHRGLEALAAIERAVELDPYNETGWLWWGVILGTRGYLTEAKQKLEEAKRLAPTTGINYGWLAFLNDALGEFEEARKNSRQAIDLGWNFGNTTAFLAHYRAGDLRAAKEAFRLFLEGFGVTDQPFEMLVESFFAPENAELRATAERVLEAAIEEHHYYPALFGSIWLKRGDQFVRFLEIMSNNRSVEFTFLWVPEYRAILRQPELKAYLREDVMVELWRIRGWPEVCQPLGSNDFVCE